MTLRAAASPIVVSLLIASCSEGAGGMPDAGGMAAAGGSAGVGTPVRIIRGDPNEQSWFSLVIEGRGLANDEGKLATVRIGMEDRPPERLGSGQVRIENGAFRIELPQGCEASLYKRKVLYIDIDGDGSCTPGVDRVYRDYRFQTGDITLTLEDSVPEGSSNMRMLLSSIESAASECQVLNQPWPES